MADILIAEDDNAMRDFLTMALKKSGHAVDDVDDGIKALSALGQKDYDLLLADIVMPGMDGVELATRATAADPDLKVMFITGFSAVAMSDMNPRRHTAQVLSKPFHLKELVDQVEQLLAD